MKKAKLGDGTSVYCIHKMEAIVLDSHVDGYLQHGIQIEDGDVVFDVGANIGLFAVRVTQRFPGTQVFAFEPTPPIYDVLAANAETFGSGAIRPMNMALGKEEGSLNLTYYPNSPALSTAHPDMWEGSEETLKNAVKGTAESAPGSLRWARFLPGFVHGWIARRMRQSAQSFHCDLRPISQVIEEQGIKDIGLLKVDCEGAELDVLMGMAAEDWGRVRQVVVEVHDHEGRLQTIREMLAGYGLTEQTVDQEEALKSTELYNIYAIRPRAEA